jgi:FAD/FMN-containing dehydrogenase
MSSLPASLAAELRGLSGVRTSVRAHVLEEASGDFGGLVRRRPAVVARPANAEQVARTLRFAAARGIPISTRGTGHSIGGQTLNAGGIVMDMRSLARIHSINAEERWVDVEAGASWHAVVRATLERGLVPPVLTGTLAPTVGGTHSVGGLGHASIRHGSQADNCLGIEVATLDGELRWCDASVEPELFQHVLCGLGQLAVITRVRHRLRKHAAYARVWRLIYQSRVRMVDDLQRLAVDSGADFMAGSGVPVGSRFAYNIAVVFEVDSPGPDERERVLSSLAPDIVRGPEVERFAAFTLHQQANIADDSRPRNGVANPWVDGLFPAARARDCLDDVLWRLPASVRQRTELQIWPLSTHCLTRPLFMVPESGLLMVVGIFPTIPDSATDGAISAMAAVARRISELGAKRYVYGWLDYDAAGWAKHYGAGWPTLRRLKARYDPQGILNPGFITYDDAADNPSAAAAGIAAGATPGVVA